MWANRHVVLGVTGGIACYKSCLLVRRLVELGAQVDVVLSRGAAEFVQPLTFEALSGRPVITSLWEPGRALAHIRLGQDPALVIVAPATAHLIARLAQGMADDFLSTMLLASTAPVLLAPAMNDEMFADSGTQQNLSVLRERGYAIVGPETGALAEGPSDRPGRMSEPDTILHHATRLLHGPGRLTGRKVLVTAGPTRESIDPVRVITNRSSGKMGYRLAQAAWYRGAEVHLVSGPSNEPPPIGATVERIESTTDLEAAVRRQLPNSDILIMAAAPADYRPQQSSAEKRPRNHGEISITLEPTPDILERTRAARKAGSLMIGFALETGDAVAKAEAKLQRKELDLIIANDALEPGAGFEVDTNRVVIVSRDGGRIDVPLSSKAEIAERILDEVEARLG